MAGGIRKTKALTELEQLKGSKAAATPRLQGQRWCFKGDLMQISQSICSEKQRQGNGPLWPGLELAQPHSQVTTFNLGGQIWRNYAEASGYVECHCTQKIH